MNLREGDIVQVTGKVSHCNTTDQEVRVELSAGEYLYTKPSGVTLVGPTIQVGDLVALRKPLDAKQNRQATVVGLANNHLWVRCDVGEYDTWHVSAVDRVALAGEKPKGGDA